jgi:hypothetical protein
MSAFSSIQFNIVYVVDNSLYNILVVPGLV